MNYFDEFEEEGGGRIVEEVRERGEKRRVSVDVVAEKREGFLDILWMRRGANRFQYRKLTRHIGR